jgi:hypothetical protein
VEKGVGAAKWPSPRRRTSPLNALREIRDELRQLARDERLKVTNGGQQRATGNQGRINRCILEEAGADPEVG